jgi:hypothetical protein
MDPMLSLAQAMGDVVRCWWPHDDRPNKPGPKFRPVFVLGETMQAGQRAWVVAYGTTHTEAERETVNGGDVIVKSGSDMKGLLKADTRFDFNYIRVIPATSKWFSAGGMPMETTSLPEEMFGLVAESMRNAGVARILKRLNVRL